MTPIPGTISPAAAKIRWHSQGHNEAGRTYMAKVDDGHLAAIVSQDPSEVRGIIRLLWHISVSHRDKNNKPDRCPNWDELKSARYQLIQADVPMMLIFPGRRAPYVNVYETCLHLWEADEGIDR